jgi:putative flippase GtrA
MSDTPLLQRSVLTLLRWLETFRYIKFGIVGASGTVVNLVVLHLGHEYLFTAIESANSKPYASLALAITLATVNNFAWNRLWTWSDRVRVTSQPPHTTAQQSDHGQLSLTLLLSDSMDYRLANVIAILIASVSNFLANDKWTFRRR